MVKLALKNILSLAAAGACLFSMCGAGAQTYHVYDLGTFGGASSNATAINSTGTIVGYSQVYTGPFLGFITRAFRHVGTGPLVAATDNLGGLGGFFSYAYAVNDQGTVVGTAADMVGTFEVFHHAGPGPMNPANVNRNSLVIHDDYGDLGDGSGEPGDGYGVGTAMNDNDEFAGYSLFGHEYAFQHLSGQGLLFNRLEFMIAPEEGDSYAYGLNNSGSIVGKAKITDGPDPNFYHATFIVDGIYTMWSDMGTMGGNNSSALALNAAGVTVGWSEITKGSSTRHAFRRYGSGDNNSLEAIGKLDKATDDIGTLGGLNSQAQAVNNHNVVVGSSNYLLPHIHELHPPATHAFVYYNSMTDLNSVLDAASAGWVLTEANGINDSGWIVGQGIINGESHAFVAVPFLTIK